MTVKEAVHQLVQEVETLAGCELYIAHGLDSAINLLIDVSKEEERNRIWNQCSAIVLDANGNRIINMVKESVFLPVKEKDEEEEIRQAEEEVRAWREEPDPNDLRG